VIFAWPNFNALAQVDSFLWIKAFFSPSMTSPWIILVTGLVLVVVGLMLAQIVRLAFKTTPLNDSRLDAEIKQAFLEAGLSPIKPRVWNTRGRVANVALVGFLPGNQLLMISDVVLEHFPRHELIAVVRHEIGHLKKNHPFKRLLLAAVPLLLLIVDLFSQVGLHRLLADSSIPLAEFAIVIGYVVYIEWLSISVFTRMEFEADRFAICDNEGRPDSQRIKELRESLRRFAAICPSELTRKGGPHPSLAERLIRLDGHSAEISL